MSTAERKKPCKSLREAPETEEAASAENEHGVLPMLRAHTGSSRAGGGGGGRGGGVQLTRGPVTHEKGVGFPPPANGERWGGVHGGTNRIGFIT